MRTLLRRWQRTEACETGFDRQPLDFLSPGRVRRLDPAVPGSITKRIRGTVSDYSATFVAMTTRLFLPGRGKTRCCSWIKSLRVQRQDLRFLARGVARQGPAAGAVLGRFMDVRVRWA